MYILYMKCLICRDLESNEIEIGVRVEVDTVVSFAAFHVRNSIKLLYTALTLLLHCPVGT